jgi:uncharacterized protein with ACT and thioredoxin-like domain
LDKRSGVKRKINEIILTAKGINNEKLQNFAKNNSFIMGLYIEIKKTWDEAELVKKAKFVNIPRNLIPE